MWVSAGVTLRGRLQNNPKTPCLSFWIAPTFYLVPERLILKIEDWDRRLIFWHLWREERSRYGLSIYICKVTRRHNFPEFVDEQLLLSIILWEQDQIHYHSIFQKYLLKFIEKKEYIFFTAQVIFWFWFLLWFILYFLFQHIFYGVIRECFPQYYSIYPLQ